MGDCPLAQPECLEHIGARRTPPSKVDLGLAIHGVDISGNDRMVGYAPFSLPTVVGHYDRLRAVVNG